MTLKKVAGLIAVLLIVLPTTNASYISKQLRDALRPEVDQNIQSPQHSKQLRDDQRPEVDQNIQRLNYAIYHAARNKGQVKNILIQIFALKGK